MPVIRCHRGHVPKSKVCLAQDACVTLGNLSCSNVIAKLTPWLCMISAKNLGQKVSASFFHKGLGCGFTDLLSFLLLQFGVQGGEIGMLILILDAMIFSSKPLKYVLTCTYIVTAIL